MPVPLPVQPGSYALRLMLLAPARLMVGRLGTFDFPVGEYLYLGSARGPGGLRGRLRHHLRVANHPRWHIDYLRQHAQVLGGWYSLDPGSLECLWSLALCRLPGAVVPAAGFGSADCRSGCPAHLLAFPQGMPAAHLLETFCLPGQNPVRVASFAAEDDHLPGV